MNEDLNLENLKTIIENCKDTEFGRKHNFDKIHSVDDYRREVPLSEYRDYAEAIKRMENGEEKVLTAWKVKHYLSTSGTGGVQKHIPLTQEGIDRYGDIFYFAPFKVMGIDIHAPKIFLSTFVVNPTAPILISTAYFWNLKEKGILDPNDYLEKERLLFPSESLDVEIQTYCKARAALSCPDLTAIQSMFLYDVLQFFLYLKSNWKMLISDIENDSFSIELPEDIKSVVKGFSKPDKAWLDKIKKEFAAGFDTPITPRIWPKLSFVTGIGGKVFLEQSEAVKSFCGDIPIFYFCYGSTECVLGLAYAPNKADYSLTQRIGFFEFLPIGGDETVLPREVEIGGIYEPIATNFSGLYRYRMGDRIRITGFMDDGLPTYEILGRNTLILNMCGEKVEYESIYRAVIDVRDKYNIGSFDYCVATDISGKHGHFDIFIEGKINPAVKESLAADIDAYLIKTNIDYKDLRNKNNIDPPVVYVIADGMMEQCRAATMPSVTTKKPLQIIKPEQREYLKERSL